MNYKILNKVLDELKKDKPDLSYVKGMIETLISFGESQTYSPATTVLKDNLGYVVTTPMTPYTENHPSVLKPSVVMDAGRIPNIKGIGEIISQSVKTE